jgi:iron complex outermembrane recepter protein
MSKARASALYVTTALACVAISSPAIAQSQPASTVPPNDTAPPLSNPATPQPNLGAPNETTVESTKVTQGVAQAPTDQDIFRPIVVTAQKRRENIQNVGISITALSGETIKTLNLTNMQQISQQVPNLEVSAWTPAFTTFNLRGISQNNFQDNLEAPVAVYQDEVYVGSMNALGLPIFDVERIEVLRGPQGTLFGRNATGGLIQFISNTADEKYLNGYAEGTIADWGTHKLEGAVGGQLASGVRARIAGFYEKSNGWMKAGFNPDPFGLNPLGPHKALGRTSQGANGWAVRANVQADLGPDTLLSVIESYSKDNDVPTGQYVVRLASADIDENGNGTGLGIDPGPPITGSVFKHASDAHTGFDRKVWSTTAKLTHSFSDNIDFTYIGNYSKLDKNYIEDAGGGLFFFPFQTIAHHKQWSHEARFSGHTQRVRWQVGAYYLDMNFDGEFDASGAIFNAAPTDAARTQGLTHLVSKNWSVFGQGEYDFSPELTGIAGLRWSQDHKKIRFRTLGFGLVDANGDPIPDGTVIFDFADQIAANPNFAGDDRINYGDVAARAQLNYKPHRDLLFYLSYNRGIKGGNWSPAPTVFIENFRHKPEVLDSYEAGMKSTLAPNTRLNLSAFYYDYHDYQAFSLTGLQPQVANSDATVKGGEVELFTRPLRNLDFALSAAFLDSNVDFVPAVVPGTGTRDAELPQAPHVSLNALGRYTVPVSFGTLAFQLDGKYASKHFLEGTNSEVSFQRGYAVGNASIALTSRDERWQGSLWVKNFTDSKYKVYNLDLGLLGFVEQMYAPPRQFGATLRFGFSAR